jgi:hypothetical protein
MMVLSMSLAGCFGGDETNLHSDFIWDEDLNYVDDPLTHEDSRVFIVGDPMNNLTWGNASWAVFGNEEGGNCCEHYLAGTKEGWILNCGGE